LQVSQTWDYARHDTFAGFYRELHTDSAPEAQMPLGMFSFWAWSRWFGTGELAMRSLNLVWAAIALAALARVGRLLSIPWLPILFAIQPFVWYYMNYARSPLMQMAGGALMLAGALGYVRRINPDGLGGILLCLGAILLSGTSMFGIVPMVAVAVGLTGLGVWNRLHLPLKGKIIAFTTATIVAVFVAYWRASSQRPAPLRAGHCIRHGLLGAPSRRSISFLGLGSWHHDPLGQAGNLEESRPPRRPRCSAPFDVFLTPDPLRSMAQA
jgi:hypothetical protein